MEEKRDTILARVETLLASNDYLIKEHPLNTVHMATSLFSVCYSLLSVRIPP